MKFFLVLTLALASSLSAAESYPPAEFLGSPDSFGHGIQRTMRLLATSTPAKRNSVRVLFYGQSITEQAWSKLVAADLQARFPYANLIIENRALGGFASQMLVRTAETDLYPFQPDLLIFHVFGSHDKYEDIIRRTRERTCAEILIQGDHINAQADWRNEETDPAKVTTKQWTSFMNYKHLPNLVAKYGTGFVDQRGVWKRYLSAYKLEPSALLKDGVHLNPQGEFLMAECVKAQLLYRPELGAAPAEEWIKTIVIGKDVQWVDGKLQIEFVGNRIDVVCRTGTAAPSAVRIDGKKPSELRELYGFSRSHAIPGGKWPPIAPISSEARPILEDWTMEIHRDPSNAKLFTFSLAGSQTGPDGEGRSDSKFVSKSGRIVISQEDWNVEYALSLAHVKPTPDHFTIGWSVLPNYLDQFTSPGIEDPAIETTVTLAHGLANTRHTLELTGVAETISALRVYHPPFGRNPQ